MQREHRVQSGTGVCQESKTCPYDSTMPVPLLRVSTKEGCQEKIEIKEMKKEMQDAKDTNNLL